MAPSCWFFWAWWLPLMLAVVATEEQGEACSAKSCGNLTISYPFWLTDMATGRSCSGSPYFEVTCYNNTPVLQSSGFLCFAIIDITYEERSVRAVDLGNQNLLHDLGNQNLLHASNSCVPTWNTSTKLGRPFTISPVNLNLVLYNCTTAAAPHRDRALVETRMRCGNQSEMLVSVGGRYDETSNYAGYAVEGCDAIVMPVLGSSSKANASDYEQLIGAGFLLTWDPPPLPPLAPNHNFVSDLLRQQHQLNMDHRIRMLTLSEYTCPMMVSPDQLAVAAVCISLPP